MPRFGGCDKAGVGAGIVGRLCREGVFIVLSCMAGLSAPSVLALRVQVSHGCGFEGWWEPG